MQPNKLGIALCMTLGASLVLAACDRRDDTAMDPAAAPPPASEPTTLPPAGEPTPMVEVTSVDLGNQVGADNRIATPMTTFATTDTMHASVITAGTGGTVSTRWTYEDGQVVHTEEKQVPGGAQVTDFMVTNADGWPTGRYTMEVLVNGQVVQTREFEVR
jgi:hypothetical protein